MKRWACVFLCVAILLSAAPAVVAEEIPVQVQMTALADEIYALCRQTSGKESFHGYCGSFVSHQMFNLGINKYFVSNDGNKLYDYYAALDKTSGGYYPRAYSLEDYDLLGALNYITRNGTRDVYNVLVGFQWTNTEAGAKYGHAVLLYGIVDGTVYFAESYGIYLDGPHAEGSLVQCSIERFAESYSKWTVYEGIVVFGTGQYLDSCEDMGTNLVVQARFDTALRSLPGLVGSSGCKKLRDIPQGERLRATAIYENGQSECFYQVAYGDTVGYVPAAAVGVLQANPQDLQVEELDVPELISVGQDALLAGTVAEKYAQVDGLEVSLLDSAGTLVAREVLEAPAPSASLEDFNELLYLDLLDAGMYTVQVYATVRAEDAKGQARYARACVAQKSLQVGGKRDNPRLPEQLPYDNTRPDNGWQYLGGWRLYREGQPVTGWAQDCGVWYYLNENGVALTGWQDIEGSRYYLTDTGARLENCQLRAKDGLYQLDEAGVATRIKK